MPKCNTPESAAKYHLFRQRLTEVKRMEREERLRLQKYHCHYCQQRIGFVTVTWWDSELEELTGRGVPVDYGTTTPHDCPERKRQKQDFALKMQRACEKKKQLEGLLHPNSSR
jgi:hypothetical protein